MDQSNLVLAIMMIFSLCSAIFMLKYIYDIHYYIQSLLDLYSHIHEHIKKIYDLIVDNDTIEKPSLVIERYVMRYIKRKSRNGGYATRKDLAQYNVTKRIGGSQGNLASVIAFCNKLVERGKLEAVKDGDFIQGFKLKEFSEYEMDKLP